MKRYSVITAIVILVGILSSCNNFFDTVPGERYDLQGTFTNRSKTEQFLNNVYSYVPDETRERWPDNGTNHGGLWNSTTLETNITWSWHKSNDWTSGIVYASSGWVGYWLREYYKGISKASTFIENVDMCAEVTANDRKLWKAQARALRALYYFMLFRTYGPTVLLGEKALPRDIPLEELLKERNSVDECIEYIVSELDLAAQDLPAKYDGPNLGRTDRGTCKAYKAKALLYAASPLFNCNPDYADIKNPDGKQLFPQDQSQKQVKWERAMKAYEEFFREFVPTHYKLLEIKVGDKVDHYESYRQATSGQDYQKNPEQIFIRLADHGDHFYETTPYHIHVDDGSIRGGLGFGTTQEIVDLFYTDKGLRIVDDPDYKEYTGVPNSSFYGWDSDYNDPIVPSRTYFKVNKDKTLKQWAHWEPRFYVCITFNGSTWVNDQTNYGKVTTELNLNGNSGVNRAGHDAPQEGYGVRKMARKTGSGGLHCATLLRLADMYLGYAECLNACGRGEEAMKQLNVVRARAGVPGYGNAKGKDANGLDFIPYPNTKEDIEKRIRRERLIELVYEWNRYFDVRRWKVADMAVGDDWIYPSYHLGGEGGAIHGMNYKADPPQFFQKVVTEVRVFDKRHYLYPIPEEDIRRNEKMVQNYGWSIEKQ